MRTPHPPPPARPPGGYFGEPDEQLAALLRGGAEADITRSVALLTARHWRPAYDYAVICLATSSQVASMVTEASFHHVLDGLGEGEQAFALRLRLLVTVRDTVRNWAADDRICEALPALRKPAGGRGMRAATSMTAENRKLAEYAFLGLPGAARCLLWHTEVEAESLSVPAGLLGLDAESAAAAWEQAREQFRQACLRAHLEFAPTRECGFHNRLLDVPIRRGGALLPDVQQHLSECSYCRHAAAQLGHFEGGLGVLIAESVLGWGARRYFDSRRARGRQALRSLSVSPFGGRRQRGGERPGKVARLLGDGRRTSREQAAKDGPSADETRPDDAETPTGLTRPVAGERFGAEENFEGGAGLAGSGPDAGERFGGEQDFEGGASPVGSVKPVAGERFGGEENFEGGASPMGSARPVASERFGGEQDFEGGASPAGSMRPVGGERFGDEGDFEGGASPAGSAWPGTGGGSGGDVRSDDAEDSTGRARTGTGGPSESGTSRADRGRAEAGRRRRPQPLFSSTGRRSGKPAEGSQQALVTGAGLSAALLATVLAVSLWPNEEGGTDPAAAIGASSSRTLSPTQGSQVPPVTSTPSAAIGAPAKGEPTRLRNVDADLCLDVRDSRAVEGAEATLDVCSSAGTQQWTYERDGLLRSAAAPALCLDARADDGVLLLGRCAGEDAKQRDNMRYDFTAEGEVLSRGRDGLAVAPASTDAGADIVVKVRDYSDIQRWRAEGR
ncbi:MULTISPECIES: RICIN domain-containing protein [unclassified Streptomyces]|uniref:RICIN domain-containing protein n=1 Tax=unclassified Streptomyces TaxID=2593676 RepID=UPI0033A9A528